ncbi:alcohol dehydrogenase zinc-binding domain protein [Hesseltinella vesiculosa]|uniref:Alcohol dehydrogenase zinc-binding domain protein n=1 Tax=Hesseltinella vesiculosa TaxID=101127 RepID=A0A1X2GV18_9FUNG|nr:alcohol dehydrogenase zinc-binding domain protein [Hesseltinella vesiculosa]
MKAAVLKTRVPELEVEQVADPVVTAGSAVVKVIASPVVHYYRHVLSGTVPFPMQLPIIPGCSSVGIVEQVGSDARAINPGDLVFCDPTIRSRDDSHTPDTILQGLFCPDGGLSDTYRNGGFAEKVIMPLENLFVIPETLKKKYDPVQFISINAMLVAYGGLLTGELQAGETVVVLGGTGYFGSTAIVVALAMGARRVVAPTRDVSKLQSLQERFGDRVAPVALGSDEQANIEAIQAAAQGPIDMALDLLDAGAPATIVRATLSSIRPHGKMILMSGSDKTVELPYYLIMSRSLTVKGCFMYPRTAGKTLIGMVDAGIIDLSQFDTSSRFSLDNVNDAMAHAEEHSQRFKLTSIVFE